MKPYRENWKASPRWQPVAAELNRVGRCLNNMVGHGITITPNTKGGFDFELNVDDVAGVADTMPFRLYKEEDGTIGVREGPVYWWFHIANLIYNSSVGWQLLGFASLTGGTVPANGFKGFYLKVNRAANGGSGDTFSVSIETATATTVAALVATVGAVGAWNVFTRLLGYVDAAGNLYQVSVGAIGFRDDPAPKTCSLWIGDASEIPAGWEKVDEVGGYFLLGTSANDAGATDAGSVTHNHALQPPTTTQITEGSGYGYVDVVTGIPSATDNASAAPPSIKVIVIRKL